MAFAHPDSDDAITQINVVPLVDIMLVILIIFMVTASFISTPSIHVAVPKALTANPTLPAARSLVLDAQGGIFYQGQKIEREELTNELRMIAALDPDLRVVLSADTSVSNGKVVALLDLVRQAGVTKIALGVEKP